MPTPAVSPVDRSTVVERLTAALIDAAVAGRFDVGRPLPPERDLADELEVNRATLRQAVARLEQIGLVTRRQGSGTVLQDPRLLTAPEVVGRVAAADHVRFLRDLIEVREALAGVIGRRAQGAIGAGQLDELRSLVAAIADENAAPVERQALELAFFGVLVEAAGNRAIAVLLRWVEDVYAQLADGARPAAVPSIAPAFADGAEVAGRLRELLEDIETGSDLHAAMTRYARETGARLLAAVEPHD